MAHSRRYDLQVLREVWPFMGRKLERARIHNFLAKEAREAGPLGRHYVSLAMALAIPSSTVSLLCQETAIKHEDLEYVNGHLRKAPKALLEGSPT